MFARFAPRAAALAAFCLVTAAAMAGTTRYHVVSLGAGTSAQALNANGVAAGTAPLQAGILTTYPAVFDHGQTRLVDTRPGSIYGLNVYQLGVGAISSGPRGDWGTPIRATMWKKDGTIVDIGTVTDPNFWSFCGGVNKHGDAVCQEQDPSGFPFDSFIYTRQTWTPIVGPGGATLVQAVAINDAGDVAGTFYSADQGGSLSFRTVGGQPELLPRFSANGWDGPAAMNNKGEVAGTAQAAVGTVAIVWTKSGRIKVIPTIVPNSSNQAMGINGLGAVVGIDNMGLAGTIQDWHAFLWQNGTTTDLNTVMDEASIAAGWDLVWANSIDDAGQILGWGSSDGGVTYEGFLATPVAQ